MADSQRIEDLRRRVQKDPASIAFAQLAEELRRAGSFEESIEACRAGLALHPAYLSARVTLGRALIETGALDEAQAELETVLKSAAENLAAIRGLAEIFQRQGKLLEALVQYRAALALARNDPDLQQTVEELAKIVEPPRPAHHAEGLSFEQMQNELFAAAPPTVLPPPSALSTPQGAQSTMQGAPGNVETDPSTLEIGPSTLEIPPSTLESVPSTLESIPSTLESVPSTSESVPSTSESVPSTLEIAPSTLGSAPSTLESAPSTLEPAPSTLERRTPSTVEPASTPLTSLPPVQSESPAEHERAQRTVAALEEWLDAIHGSRTQPRA